MARVSEGTGSADEARMPATDAQVDVAVQTEETPEQISQLRSELNSVHATI